MPRLKGNAKEIIMEESLKLFSVYGFEAVSVRTIADKVGIGNSALYKHFESKQAIFDALVEMPGFAFLAIGKEIVASFSLNTP